MTKAYLHGGPLDGSVRTVPDDEAPELTDFEYEDDGGTWYVQYRRTGTEGQGAHYEATGTQERADEE